MSITGDTSHFQVRDIFILEEVIQEVDPNELPPGHHGPPPKHKVLQVVRQADKSGPIGVEKGQKVLVRVKYLALYVEGTFAGTLEIKCDSENIVQEPLSLYLSQIDIAISEVLTIAQGHQANLPIRITSLMGPGMNISYRRALSQLHSGLTLLPNLFHLDPRETKSDALVFQADSDAPLGPNDVYLEPIGSGPSFVIKVNIVRPQLVVNPAQPNSIRARKRDRVMNIPIHISLSGGTETWIDFSPTALPSGVGIQGGSFSIQSDTIVNFEMHLGIDTPDRFAFSINWSAFNGEQNGAIDYNVAIVPSEIHLTTSIVTPEGFPLGGGTSLLVRDDGSYEFSGFMRATGFTSYKYALQVFLHAPATGDAIAAMNTGHVFGTDTPGDRQLDWHESGTSSSLAMLWDGFLHGASLKYTLNADISGVTGTLWDVAKIGLDTIAGFVIAGPVGGIVVLGRELTSALNITLVTPGSLVGFVIVGGIVMVCGPGVLIPAVVAGVVLTNLTGIHQRSMTDQEQDFAWKVFADKLPFERIILTNLVHGSERQKYTIPSVDGSTILVNLGEAFQDPMTWADSPNTDYAQPGSVFIHELTHAWQIATTWFQPGLICKLSSNYDYYAGSSEKERLADTTWSTRSWSNDFNLEQQAHIVDDWYGAHYPDLKEAAALTDPAFHFIRDNIRTGQV